MKNILTTIALLWIAGSAIKAQNLEGIASYYSDYFVGRTTANGEIYTHDELTAASLDLPFNTIVKVKNLQNNKEVIVRINDRGPYVDGRIIDLSQTAARELDMIWEGIVEVKLEILETLADGEVGEK